MTLLYGYFILLAAFFLYTYGFVDLNLHLTSNSWFLFFQRPLSSLVFQHMKLAGIFYIGIVIALFAYYRTFLKKSESDYKGLLFPWKNLFIGLGVFAIFSFPAFTYDIFNYMTTASVTYTHRENPYIVMPIEIPNEPGLAYTRAANKVALYGPTWLILSFIPHVLPFGNVWLKVIAFKAFIVLFWGIMSWLIWKHTKSMRQVVFFALNPLMITEILVSAHNDIVMMVFALLAFLPASLVGTNLWKKVGLWFLSVGVKGATLVLGVLFLNRFSNWAKRYAAAYWLLFSVFVFVAPLREELYPWYAVWFMPFAALIPITKRSFIHGFSIALTLGLIFRHLPYILTREYEGSGPVLRIIFTVVPLVVYCAWYLRKYGIKALLRSASYA